MQPLRYPLGIQDFSELRTRQCVYVDKTKLLYSLLEGKAYFYAHPRRFGKSLLLSTLKYLFQGRQDLFQGLWIADKIDWATFNYPVLHFSFIDTGFHEIGFERYIHQKFRYQAEDHDLVLTSEGVSGKVTELVKKLYYKHNQKVVFLVDEYDKPITEYLLPNDIATAQANKQWLRQFYSPLKELDPYLQFVFITGVSKFSKVSLFSDLNQLEDITLSKPFATLLGYTEPEILHYFQPRLAAIATQMEFPYEELLDKMRKWYNGYSWNGKDKVYNPTSMLHFLKYAEFSNYWFETGTPTFLINRLRGDFTYNIEEIRADAGLLQSFRLESLNDTTLLFQTGYLTVKAKQDDIYTLGYPNQEVRDSMLQYLLAEFSQAKESIKPLIRQVYYSLAQRNFAQLFKLLQGLFGSIPYQLFDAHQEKYYHAIIFLTFRLLGYYTQAEPSVSEGRIDVVVETQECIFLFEFKVNGTVAEAMQQIHDRKYYQQYAGTSKEVYLVGVVCKNKGIGEYEVEKWN
jgi:hypothetical protein